MKMILGFMKPYKKESILAPLFKMLEAIFELFVPLVVADIIDNGIAMNNRSYIVKMVLLMVGLAVIGLICSCTAQYFSAKAAIGGAGDMRHELFKHIQKLSYTELDKQGTETLITRMTSDINSVQNGINLVLRLFLRSPFIVFGAMIMAFRINFKAGLVFLVTIAALSIVVFTVMAVTRPMYKKSQASLDKILSITRENLTGVRVIRAFNCENEEIKSFKENNNLLVKIQKTAGKISGLSNPLTFIMINFGIIVLVYVCSVQSNQGIIFQGETVALYNLMSQILVELVKLANLIVTVTKALACAGRINDAFETLEENDNGHAVNGIKNAPAIIFKDVDFSYHGGGDTALSDINFKLNKGETLGIIGGTGSGKSTLINLIMGFYPASSGEILIDGININDYSKDVLRKRMGLTPQKAQLFKGTIRENLTMGNLSANDEQLQNALEISQAKEFVDKKEGGLDFVIEQGGKNLSGGQRQRLTIARAIAVGGDFLALDDSASALDYATDSKLRKALRNMPAKPTVIISSQRASSVMFADQIIVLEDGQAVGIGTHDMLMKNCEVYKEIYYSQFPKEEVQ